MKNNFKVNRLLVIISDRLSDLVKKGEITARYYNPGEMFNEVHILMTNDDKVDPAAVQNTVGSAKLFLYNLPTGNRLFLRSLGWQPSLLKGWLDEGIGLARRIRPDLVRTHSSFIEGYLAKAIKDEIGTPYVISLHAIWDKDYLISTKARIIKSFLKKFERVSFPSADCVITVYRSILGYAKTCGSKNVQLIYNAVAGDKIERKDSYKLSRPPRIVTINRQLKGKDPENIIRAIKDIDCHYVIIGDGEYHERLKNLAKSLGCRDKVEFIRAIPNDKLCKMLNTFDIMVSHCDYWGMPKTIMEAAIGGLPVIINKHPIEPVPEYEDGWLMPCDNTPDGYKTAIQSLLNNESLRTDYGQRARRYAMANFDPLEMENKIVAVYKKALNIIPEVQSDIYHDKLKV